MFIEYSKQNIEDTYSRVRFISTNKYFPWSTLTYYFYERRFEITIQLNTPALELEFWISNRQNQHKNNNRLEMPLFSKNRQCTVQRLMRVPCIAAIFSSCLIEIT